MNIERCVLQSSDPPVPAAATTSRVHCVRIKLPPCLLMATIKISSQMVLSVL